MLKRGIVSDERGKMMGKMGVEEMRGRTPPKCGQKGVFVDSFQCRSTVSLQTCPKFRNKLVPVLCMGCGENASASELNMGQVGVRTGMLRGTVFHIPPCV